MGVGVGDLEVGEDLGVGVGDLVVEVDGEGLIVGLGDGSGVGLGFKAKLAAQRVGSWVSSKLPVPSGMRPRLLFSPGLDQFSYEST